MGTYNDLQGLAFGWELLTVSVLGTVEKNVSSSSPRVQAGALCESGTTALRSAAHGLSDVRSERYNAALPKAEIAVPSHKATEIE